MDMNHLAITAAVKSYRKTLSESQKNSHKDLTEIMQMRMLQAMKDEIKPIERFRSKFMFSQSLRGSYSWSDLLRDMNDFVSTSGNTNVENTIVKFRNSAKELKFSDFYFEDLKKFDWIESFDGKKLDRPENFPPDVWNNSKFWQDLYYSSWYRNGHLYSTILDRRARFPKAPPRNAIFKF